MDKNNKGTMTYTFLIVALVLAATVYFVPLDISSDENLNKLFKDIIIRLIVFATLCFVVVAFGLKAFYTSKDRQRPLYPLLFAAVFVALVQLPLHALIVGSAKIVDRVMCVTLAAECVAVAAMEELFFRGILFEAVADQAERQKERRVFSGYNNRGGFFALSPFEPFERRGRRRNGVASIVHLSFRLSFRYVKASDGLYLVRRNRTRRFQLRRQRRFLRRLGAVSGQILLECHNPRRASCRRNNAFNALKRK